MRITKPLSLSMVFGLALIVLVAASVLLLEPSKVSNFRLYELFGATFAVLIATSGIYGMKKLT